MTAGDETALFNLIKLYRQKINLQNGTSNITQRWNMFRSTTQNRSSWSWWRVKVSVWESVWKSRVARKGGRCRCWRWAGAGRPAGGWWWRAWAGIPLHWQEETGWRSRSTPARAQTQVKNLPFSSLHEIILSNEEDKAHTRSCLSVMFIFSTMDQNQRLNCSSFSAFSPASAKLKPKSLWCNSPAVKYL